MRRLFCEDFGMRIGKLENALLEKLILDKFTPTRRETDCAPRVGMDCAVLHMFSDKKDAVVLSTDPITAATNRIGYLTVHINCNDAATVGAEPVGLLVTLLAPPDITEDMLGDIADDIARAAKSVNVDIIGGHTEITTAVNRIVSSATVIARPVGGKLIPSNGMLPGDDVVITKFAGMEGTAILAMDMPDKLELTPDELNVAIGFTDGLSVIKEGLLAAVNGAHAMHDVTEGGVFGALYEMAYASNVACDVDADAIPIHPVTNKICSKLNLNPYRLLSSGAMLIACPDGEEMVRILNSEGIEAHVIASVREGRGLYDVSGREIAPPESDEIYNAIP